MKIVATGGGGSGVRSLRVLLTLLIAVVVRLMLPVQRDVRLAPASCGYRLWLQDVACSIWY